MKKFADMFSLGRPANAPDPAYAKLPKIPDKPDEPKKEKPPVWDQDFQNWQRAQTPHYTTVMLNHLKPTIETGLKTYGGSAVSPMLRSQAKQLAIHAMRTYDPTKSALNTHVMNTLQRLQRLQARDSQIIHVPERHLLGYQFLQEAEEELASQLQRPPTAIELADHTGLSVKRIAKLRATTMPVAASSLMREHEDEIIEPAVEQDMSLEAAKFVYDDLTDPTDKLIMEYGLGLHGQKKTPASVLAKRLRISTSAVSQRAARIQTMIDAIRDSGVL